ncbi:thiol reductant ABC exporter subunit CydD [Thalassovita gelatinovora]|nr:thiol reductant ABC exporter subunit CydD [Thalassovita gelatinovora]
MRSLGSVLSLAAALIWPLQAALIANALAGLLQGREASPFLVAAAFFVLAILRAGLLALSQRKLSEDAEFTLTRLRSELVEREATATGASVIGGPGALAALAGEKLEALRPYLMRYRPARMRVSVLPVVILLITLWYSWACAVVLLMAGPLIPLFMALVGWAAKDASERQMVEIGALSDLLVDRLAALYDLRLIGAGGPVVQSFEHASESLRERTMAVLRIAFLSSTVLELFSALGVAMIAVWVGFSLLGQIGWGTWGQGLDPFAGIFLLLLAPDYFQPLRDLAAAWHDKAAGEAVLDEMQTWRNDARPQLIGDGGAATTWAGPVAIGLRGVVLRQANQRLIYPDIDIKAGTRTALIGKSGAGKTSLLRLLAGLARPEQGQVLIGDEVLSDANADGWRARLGWMPQAPHFLSQSLRYNIGFGQPVTDGTLMRARINGVIAALPKGDLTLLGDRGAGLSGGEARRVTLARALQSAPDVLLADEPTADLDADTAEKVITGLMDYAAEGGTLIVATHDPRLIERMDHVVEIAPDRERVDP